MSKGNNQKEKEVKEKEINEKEVGNKELETNQQTETESVEEPVDIQGLNAQITEYKNLVQRIQAEFDNYRKRNNESIRVSRNEGINDVIVALFPLIDNFERAINAINDEGVKSGIELIYKQIVNILKKFDVVEIVALGEEFDPQLHHAIAQCEDSENTNKIVEVYQKGYKRKEKVLRPSMVKVAQ